MVRTNFFDNLNFLPGDDPENAISVDDISNSVANILTLNTVSYTHLTLPTKA